MHLPRPTPGFVFFVGCWRFMFSDRREFDCGAAPAELVIFGLL